MFVQEHLSTLSQTDWPIQFDITECGSHQILTKSSSYKITLGSVETK